MAFQIAATTLVIALGFILVLLKRCADGRALEQQWRLM